MFVSQEKFSVKRTFSNCFFFAYGGNYIIFPIPKPEFYSASLYC